MASPRKMCVPGVHACAIAGVSISASSTASAILPAETARGDALTLPTDRFPEIVQLVLDDVVDCVLRRIDVIAHLIDHVVDGNAINQIFAPLDRRPESTLCARRSPARAFYRAVARPSCAFASPSSGPSGSLESRQPRERRATSGVANKWADRTAPRWPTP